MQPYRVALLAALLLLGSAASPPRVPSLPTPGPLLPVFLRINDVYVLYIHPKGPTLEKPYPAWPGIRSPSDAVDHVYVPLQNTAALLGVFYDDDPRYVYPPHRHGSVTVAHRGKVITFGREGVSYFDRRPGRTGRPGSASRLAVPVAPYSVGDRGDLMVPFHLLVTTLELSDQVTFYGLPARPDLPPRSVVLSYTIPGALWDNPLEDGPFAIPENFRDSLDLLPSRFSRAGVRVRESGQLLSQDRVEVLLESAAGRRYSADQVAVQIAYVRLSPGAQLAGTHMLLPPDRPPPRSPCLVWATRVSCTVLFDPDPNPAYFGGARVRYVLMRVRTPR